MADLRDCMGPGELDRAALNVMNLLAWYLMNEEKKKAMTPSPQSSPHRGEEVCLTGEGVYGEVYGDVPKVPEEMKEVGGGN